MRRVGLLRRQQQALLQEQGRRVGVAQRQPPQRQVQRRDWHLLRVSGGQLEGVTRDAEVWLGGIVLGRLAESSGLVHWIDHHAVGLLQRC